MMHLVDRLVTSGLDCDTIMRLPLTLNLFGKSDDYRALAWRRGALRKVS
jgi:hypothetical protein